MAKVLGFNEKLNKRVTCYSCTAIVEYKPNEEIPLVMGNGHQATDEGRKIVGLNCPNCGTFLRTNH